MPGQYPRCRGAVRRVSKVGSSPLLARAPLRPARPSFALRRYACACVPLVLCAGASLHVQARAHVYPGVLEHVCVCRVGEDALCSHHRGTFPAVDVRIKGNTPCGRKTMGRRQTNPPAFTFYRHVRPQAGCKPEILKKTHRDCPLSCERSLISGPLLRTLALASEVTARPPPGVPIARIPRQ